MSELVERVAKAIYGYQFGTGLAGALSQHEAEAIARAAIEAIEASGYRIVTEDEWPEPGPNSVFSDRTTTSVSLENLWVDIVTPEPDRQ